MEFLNDFLIFKQILAPILAFTISLYVMPAIIRIAIKKDLVAKPNHRTSHKGRIPNIGGISIFIGFIFAFLFCGNISQYPSLQFFILGLICIFFIGLKDDILIISARKKFLGEILAILIIVILGDIRITHLHDFFNIGEINYFVSILLTTFVAAVIINALNLIDGIDGLASGVGIIACLFFGIAFLFGGGAHNVQLAIIALCTLGALIPFFLYNVFGVRNKIFMGDAGALSLGFIISILTIEFCQANIQANTVLGSNTAPIIAISILILPLFDTIRVFIIRLSQGKSPFRPDKNHLHHCLLALGFNHKQSTAILLTVNVLFIGIAFAGRNLPGWLLLSLLIGLAVVLSEFLRMRLKLKEKKKTQLSSSSVTSVVHN